MKISKVIIVINRTKHHARQTASALKAFFDRDKVRQEWIETLPTQKNLYRKMAGLRDRKADLVVAVAATELCCRRHIASEDRSIWKSKMAEHRYGNHVKLLAEECAFVPPG